MASASWPLANPRSQGMTEDAVPMSAVRTLALTHFRNHIGFTLSAQPGIIVLTGQNGAGKTNILEALSLFVPGRGLRGSAYADMANRDAAQGWTIFAEIDHEGERHAVGMSYVPTGESQERRIIKINGTPAKNQQELAYYLSAVWLTPEMNHMFSEGSGARRRFLDRLAYSFDPEHAGRIAAYEHCMRERNRLLGLPRAEAAWFSAVEKKMAEYSVAIAAVRLVTTERLQHALEEATTGFPKPRLSVEGEAEYMLRDGMAALAIEEWLEEKLSRIRDEDRQNGRSGAGAHRTSLRAYHPQTGIEAEHCSTGQQKALLTAMILAHARARKAWAGSAPILLLDEAVAHLDATRRAELFEEIESLGAQAWLTGTDTADFTGSTPGKKLINIK